MNNYTVATYNPKDVTMTFGGYVITDWEEIEVVKNTPIFKQHLGIGGKNTRVHNPDKSCTIKARVLQTGMANSILSEIVRLDSIHNSARIILMVKDLSGDSLFHTTTAYITSMPDMKYSGGFEWREWELACDDYDAFKVSGNIKPQSKILDAVVSGLETLKGVF